mgnify:CR=1 FL=1
MRFGFVIVATYEPGGPRAVTLATGWPVLYRSRRAAETALRNLNAEKMPPGVTSYLIAQVTA